MIRDSVALGGNEKLNQYVAKQPSGFQTPPYRQQIPIPNHTDWDVN